MRAIAREDICRHPNKNFRISIIEQRDSLLLDYALDIVLTLKRSLEEGKRVVMILPAVVPAYTATLINTLQIPCRHLHTFNMDEYADDEGNTAPITFPASFQRMIRESFFSRIEEHLRPPEEQMHFPTGKNIGDYGKMIADLGGADVCYGQVGWNGHLAFYEAEMGREFDGDIEAYMKAGPRIVEISPMTVMQNSLWLSKGGDWSWHPPKAATIGPAEVAGAKRNSWRNYAYIGGGISWQRFIVRLVAHGPVTPLVPSSILQRLDTDFKILGAVAEDCNSPV